jgi:hypothetical protein
MSIPVARISTPVIHVSSRGYLYAPNRKTRPMCRKSRMMNTLAPQRCMPRTSQPSVRSLVIAWIDEYAMGFFVIGSIAADGS